MDFTEISGKRQLAFMQDFDYIREAGTEAEQRAAERIAEEIRSFGLTPETEEFTIDTYEIEEAGFAVTGPYQKEYTVSGYAGCGSTPEEGVEAPFLYAENGDDISLTYAAGKIVMVNAPVRAEMYKKLEQAGAVGFLSISGTPIDSGEDLKPVSCTLRKVDQPTIQGVCIHCTDAAEIVEEGASRARLTVRQKKASRTSRNVRVRIEGTDRAEEILTLTAHFDSVPAGPGAYDNMAGGAIIMELCRYFSAHRPRRTLEFIWFGAEEKGLKGSLAYVEAHREELKRHRFNMNVDLAGQLVGGNVMGVTGDASICQMLSWLAHEAGMGVSFRNNIWGSDSNTFAWNGIPAMTLNRDGFGMHTRHDTLALISPWSLERSARLLGYVAEHLSEAEVFPFVQKIPEEMMKDLDEYFKE